MKFNWRLAAAFGLLLAVFLVSAFHEKYPDEFDSIVGGKYILQGKIPYRDWFQHHQPGAYVLSAILLPFSGVSFVRHRILTNAVFFLIVAGTYFMLRRRTRHIRLPYYLLFAFTLAVSTTYFWGHMLLADTLAAYLFLPGYFLLLYREYYREPFTRNDLLVVTLSAFLVWFTSMTYLFAVAGMVAYAMYLYASRQLVLRRPVRRVVAETLFITGIPYVGYFLFLAATGSLADWYFANVTYNQEYYIFNYPRPPGAAFNPLRYAIIIANNFVNNYFPALWGAMRFPIGDPLQVTLAASNAVFFAVLILAGRGAFLVPFLCALVFANSRSNPQQIAEKDYWASVYIMLSFINGTFALAALTDMVNRVRESPAVRAIAGGLLLFLWVYWFSTPIAMFLKMENKFFPKYMGVAPLIYDRPEVAPYVNRLVSRDEYAWIGPFCFEELFYLNARIPSQYHWFLDPAAKSKIKDEIIADFERTRPLVVVFKRNYAPWGGDPAGFNSFMTSFLDRGYFRIYLLNQTLDGYRYRWKLGNTEHFDLDGDFNFSLEHKDELLRRLTELGYVEKIPL